jgi:hypothetical protein
MEDFNISSVRLPCEPSKHDACGDDVATSRAPPGVAPVLGEGRREALVVVVDT